MNQLDVNMQLLMLIPFEIKCRQLIVDLSRKDIGEEKKWYLFNYTSEKKKENVRIPYGSLVMK